MEMIKVLVCLGTRPEGIKMAPVIKALEDQENRFEFRVCSTGQHREMLDKILGFFEIDPDYNLDLMTDNQSLGSLSSKVLFLLSIKRSKSGTWKLHLGHIINIAHFRKR